MANQTKSISPTVASTMRDRIANGLDPLTGEPIMVVGMIRRIGNACFDETGRQVILDSHSNWVYAK